MLTLMAAHDVEGQMQLLLRVLTSAEWHALWTELAVRRVAQRLSAEKNLNESQGQTHMPTSLSPDYTLSAHKASSLMVLHV